jgi:hypothetical protein
VEQRPLERTSLGCGDDADDLMCHQSDLDALVVGTKVRIRVVIRVAYLAAIL